MSESIGDKFCEADSETAGAGGAGALSFGF